MSLTIGEFVDTFPPNLDGVGNVTLAYCQTLKTMGHTAYYIAPDSPLCTQTYDIPLLLSKSLHFPGEQFRAGVPMLDAEYREKLDQIPFDIVHCHSPFLAAHEAIRVAHKRNIPVVSTFHSKYYDDFYAKTHSHSMAKVLTENLIKVYNRCDAVWSLNAATAEVLHSYGYEGNILIMENGTNLEYLEPEVEKEMRARLKLQQGVPVLLFVGQHNYKKNLHGVLGAAAILKKQQHPFRLILAGDGPDFDAIVKESVSLGISDECTFMGFVSDRQELLSLYRIADLFVFPSLYDNAPMVLREAASMGTPGLLVKGSCSAEGITDGVNGYISPDESAQSIAETILRALPTVDTVGLEAQKTVPVSWSTIMEKVVIEYERLINGHVASRRRFIKA